MSGGDPCAGFRLDGRVALVTGASSGLGRHFAGLLARAGAQVAAAARRLGPLEEVVAEIGARGGTAAAVALDVTDAASVRSAFDEAEARLGGVDLVVNNAGLAVTRPLLEFEEADWDRVMDTNLKGAWLVAQEAARRMVARGAGGVIVNVASILGLRVAGAIPAYCASKAGLIHLTRAMALDLARHGVRVNALAPGYLETELNREFFATEAGRRLVARVPMRRLGRLEELDGPLLLLASEAGRYLTGSVLAADGGHLVSTL
ncbi:MAG: SDR family NAD(P)-dependent oxidoreductase [Deferrisomatales bacterium]